MKRVIISVPFLLLILFACHSNKKIAGKSFDTEKTDSPPDGKDLVGKSDCYTCHKIDEKMIGPAWSDVAAKYPLTDVSIEYIAKKIITGGSGVWGAIPMVPHPAMSFQDAKAIAQYVLNLKTNK